MDARLDTSLQQAEFQIELVQPVALASPFPGVLACVVVCACVSITGPGAQQSTEFVEELGKLVDELACPFPASQNNVHLIADFFMEAVCRIACHAGSKDAA